MRSHIMNLRDRQVETEPTNARVELRAAKHTRATNIEGTESVQHEQSALFDESSNSESHSPGVQELILIL